MSNRNTNIIAVALILIMFFMAVSSIKDDSLTMDELAHLPAGYSYLTQKDMRLNPEHPPLLKDLAAIPLLFIKGINFPSDVSFWKDDVNGQWAFGWYFLFQAGNPADQMIFWGRIPMILIMIVLGFYIFKWTRELFGNNAGLLALFLFSFSPTFLAHGRLVTTDVGAAAGAFISIYYFIKALSSPTKKNIILSGISLAIAELFKFSAILLIPAFVFYGLVWWLMKMGNLKQTLKVLISVFVLAFVLIWPVYQYHVWNYPPEKQAKDAETYLASYADFIKKPILWAADKPILRPYAQYFTGLLMVFNRVVGGNTTYFLGEVSNRGWRYYFPVVYAMKETLTFHILSAVSLIYAFWFIKKYEGKNLLTKALNLVKSYFPEFACLSFIGLYWAASVVGTLNIGVRHLLPAFPFTILLVSGTISVWMKEPYLKFKKIILAALILWQVISIASVYPHFLSYFNELAGGPNKGYFYVVDSNFDWGQDLKRLANWVNEKGINKIYVDYFGGADTKYYLKDKVEGWSCGRSKEELPKGSYLAVSASFLMSGTGVAAKNFDQQVPRCYQWLSDYQPIEKIGYSIFIYKID
ncbi:MAG: glycosyltransferase family 39 protein [Candidatus Nealsonbacteria bacterium]|nr:glycosyltransferase family 39 protein [Candidatus Nealsonbacteria bacterium]